MSLLVRIQKIGTLYSGYSVNSLLISATIAWHWFESTLAEVTTCCLTAPSHYLKQCWLIINGVLLHSTLPRDQFIEIAEVINSYSELDLYTCEFTPTSLRVNELKGLTYFVFSIQYPQFVINCLKKTPSLSKCGKLLGPTCMYIVINYQTFHELTKRYFY